MAEVNIERLNAAIARAQPKYEQKVAAKQSEDPNLQALGLTSVRPAAGGIDTVLLTFCTAWPKVYPVLTLGLKFAGWFMPAASVGLARAVLEGIHTEVYPALCPKT